MAWPTIFNYTKRTGNFMKGTSQPSSTKLAGNLSLKNAMREVFTNKPSTVKPASPEKERKQMIAIAYSKARRGY